MQFERAGVEAEYWLVHDLVASDSDDVLRTIQLAVFLENALGLTLPDDVLDWAHLGTWRDVQRTVAVLGAA